jgi:hypothetical protein
LLATAGKRTCLAASPTKIGGDLMAVLCSPNVGKTATRTAQGALEVKNAVLRTLAVFVNGAPADTTLGSAGAPNAPTTSVGLFTTR